MRKQGQNRKKETQTLIKLIIILASNIRLCIHCVALQFVFDPKKI